MKSEFGRWVVVMVFLLAAVWYFWPMGQEYFVREVFRMRLALPAAVLAVGSVGLVPGLISLGFVFCTVGDALGVAGSFEGQIAGFAVAQICFISQFVKDIKGGSRKIRGEDMIVAGLVCVIPLVIAAVNVMPGVKSMALRIGCIVYAVLLSASLFTSIVRCFTLGRYVAMIGCAVFLVSDFIIAWNKFTEHIPHSGVYIMTTYYAALLLIFTGTLRRG